MAKNFDFNLKSFDTLIGNDTPSVVSVPVDNLHTFKNHPFKVIDDDKMNDLVESIKENGVLTPAIVRETADGYELISGHRRKHACELAGITEMPVIIQDLTDDEATVMMVDANIQREELLPSEKAFAYKMKLEALKRKPGRPTFSMSMEIDKFLRHTSSEFGLKVLKANADDKPERIKYIRQTYRNRGGNSTGSNYIVGYFGVANGIEFTFKDKSKHLCTWTEIVNRIDELIRTDNYLSENPTQIEQKKASVEILAEEVGESRANVQRFIRLTNLLTDLLDLVDDKQLPVNVGVELSYLSIESQEMVANTIDDLEIMPTIAMAKQLRGYENKGELTNAVVEVIFKSSDTTEKPVTLKLDKETKKLFPASYNKKDMTDLVAKLVKEYFEKIGD